MTFGDTLENQGWNFGLEFWDTLENQGCPQKS